MRIVADLRELERGRPAIVTIGSFDGVHRGHQFLIRQVVERARSLDFDSVVITFDPRPEVVLRPGTLQLTDGAAKARVIAALGATTLAVLPFTAEVSQTPAGAFLSQLLDHVNMGEIWLGADFAFGHKRGGNIDFLVAGGAAGGYDVHVVHRRALGHVPISSSLIRARVSEGDVSGAAHLLGHYFTVSGPVVRGAGRGRELGYPTANIGVPDTQQLPGTGIYAGYVRLRGRKLQAAASVGYNVQFDGARIVVEAHILDFDEDIYGEEIALDLVAKVREERKFDSVDALIDEMGRDVAEVRRVLSRTPEPGELLLD